MNPNDFSSSEVFAQTRLSAADQADQDLIPPLDNFMLPAPNTHGVQWTFDEAPCKTGLGGPEHLANVAESMGWDYAEALAQQSETAELQLFHYFASL